MERVEGFDNLDVLVIANPVSGQPEPVLAPLGGVFGERGLRWQVSITRKDLSAAAIAEAAIQAGVPTVAVYGGDGTVSEVAGAVAHSDTRLGLLPGGTGNGLARDLGVPPDIAAAAAMVADRPRVQNVDVMACQNGGGDNRVCVLRAAVGLEAEMVLKASREEKQRLGEFAYFLEAMRAMGDTPMRTWDVVIDGERQAVDAVSVALANAGIVGPGGTRVVEGVSIDDGRIDLVALIAEDLAALAAAAGQSLLGGRSDRVVHLSGSEIRLEASEPQAAILDGEEFGMTPLVARVDRGALNVIVPAAGATAA